MATTRCLAALAVLLLASGTAQAHAIWIAERVDRLTLVYGHGAGDDAYDPTKIVRVAAVMSDGTVTDAKVEPTEFNATLAAPSGAVALALDFDEGFWSERADGEWVNEPKSKVPDAKSAGRYHMHTVALFDAEGELPTLPEQTLQIVPLVNPATLRVGAELPVRVLFQGEPLAGAEVSVDQINLESLKAQKTDADGQTVVAIRNAGLNVLGVYHSVATPDDPDADEIGHMATLAFTPAPEPE